MSTRFGLDDDGVVVIVGSGAGGGTLACELAMKGVKSVVLEAGKRFTMDDIENDEWAMFKKVSWLDKRHSAGGSHLTQDDPNLPAWIVKGVGGSTIHWAGVALRIQEHEFRQETITGGVPDANLLDWPLTLAELVPWYEKAELKMGVTGAATGMPHPPWNNNFKVLAEGSRRIGFSRIQSGPMAINTAERDGRPACQQTGFCMQGCKFQAKWSTMYTEIPRAEATGNCEVRPNAMALKIEHDASGKVTGVVYADGEGRVQRQQARIVCVAGNSIESPRLLLNSASSKFPDGLANSSGQVGRNYMTHSTAGVFAVMPHPVHMNRGTTVAGIVSDQARHGPERGFVGGYQLEVLGLGLGFLAAFLVPGPTGWGREVSKALERYKYLSGVWIVGDDLPQEANRITLHGTDKDQYGLPVPIVTKTPHANDINLTNHAYRTMRNVYEAVGSSEIYNLPSFPGSHNMGTNRMSQRPRDGVVDGNGQAHDIKNLFVSDGSQFTSSSTENPTLTIVALAIRQADHIAGAMRRGEI